MGLLQDNASPDEQIQIQLVSVPMYGLLARSQSQQEPQELREYSSFTMEDVNTLRIRSDTPPILLLPALVSIVPPAVSSDVSYIKQEKLFCCNFSLTTPTRKEYAQIAGFCFLVIKNGSTEALTMNIMMNNKGCNY